MARYVIILFLFLSSSLHAQNKNVGIYKNVFNSKVKFGFEEILKFSKGNNSYDFMALGYFINANNNMYLKTSDTSFLSKNLSVIAPILLENGSSNYKKDSWKMNVSKDNQNAIVNGLEHLVSEGYFFRYLGEFYDILIKNKLYTNHQRKIEEGLIYSFKKWRYRSFDKYGDYSLFFHQRFHISANWAVVALYLKKYDSVNESTYSSFINLFDEQLHKSLKVKAENGIKYYTWTMTYPEKFTKMLKNVKNDNALIQDVSHGNHVVLYFIKAKELDNKNWENFNFGYLVNTLRYKILRENSIADNIDGSTSAFSKNTGWKISDGWYKLIYFDNSLYSEVQRSLGRYQKNIKKSSLELQFNSIYL